MSSATITITDDENGRISMALDFGEAFNTESVAHGMIATLAKTVLDTAGDYRQIEDTAPEVNVEPSHIITPNND